MPALTAFLAAVLFSPQESSAQAAPATTPPVTTPVASTPQSAPEKPATVAPQDAAPKPAAAKPAAKPAKKPGAATGAPAASGAKTVKSAKEGGKESSIVVPTPRPRPPEIPSYRISLRMKNGRRFMGVVSRDKAFHDLVHSGAHHTDAAYKRTDRFTLRFVDGLDGEIELKWSQVSKLEVREILDSAGLRAMETDYFHARVVRNEALEQLPELPPELASEEAPEGAAEGEEKPAAEGDAESPADAPKKEEPELITEFSPQSGWTPDRKKQIEWRRTVVGAFPDEREQRFLDVYDEWFPHYEKWVKDEQERIAAEEAKTKAEARGARKTDRGDDKGEPKAPPKDSPKDAPPAPKDAPPAPKDAPKDPPKDDGKAGGRS